MEQYGQHKPILLDEIINFLSEKHKIGDEIKMLDLTFGGGGHSKAFLEKFPLLKLWAVDQDHEAIANAKELLKKLNLENRVKLIHENFKTACEKILAHDQVEFPKSFDFILADLGVSSHQFDSKQRGFSFRYDAQLDMRMDQRIEVTAKDVVNDYDEFTLAEIFFKYGEEQHSRVIAKNIVQARSIQKIETTKELENICFHSYPAKHRHGRTHPATKVFQALRIYVNQELEVLEFLINSVYHLLSDQGRVAIITFHSLEDRLVKHGFRSHGENFADNCVILTKKPVIPTDLEMEQNPRSRSAKLRVLARQKVELKGKKWGKSKQSIDLED